MPYGMLPHMDIATFWVVAHLYHGDPAGPLLDIKQVDQPITEACVWRHGHVVSYVRGLQREKRKAKTRGICGRCCYICRRKIIGDAPAECTLSRSRCSASILRSPGPHASASQTVRHKQTIRHKQYTTIMPQAIHRETNQRSVQ